MASSSSACSMVRVHEQRGQIAPCYRSAFMYRLGDDNAIELSVAVFPACGAPPQPSHLAIAPRTVMFQHRCRSKIAGRTFVRDAHLVLNSVSVYQRTTPPIAPWAVAAEILQRAATSRCLRMMSASKSSPASPSVSRLRKSPHRLRRQC